MEPPPPSEMPEALVFSAEPASIRRSSGVDQARRLSLLTLFVINLPSDLPPRINGLEQRRNTFVEPCSNNEVPLQRTNAVLDPAGAKYRLTGSGRHCHGCASCRESALLDMVFHLVL